MCKAENELAGSALKRTDVVLSFMGSGASCNVTAGDLDDLCAKLAALESQEPVHWRAVLSTEDVIHEPDPRKHIAGFSSLSAADEWISAKHNIEGWNYSLEPLYAHPAPAQPAVAVPEFLLEMAKQMRDQPNRGTSHPFWQVRCKRYMATEEGYNEHHREVVAEDGPVHSSLEPLSQLHEYLSGNHPSWCEKWAAENHDEYEDWEEALSDHFDLDSWEWPDDLKVIHMQECEEVVSTHLTQDDAQWFIKRKQHDYPPLYTHVESAYWAPQLRQLQDWIISLATSPAADGEKV